MWSHASISPSLRGISWASPMLLLALWMAPVAADVHEPVWVRTVGGDSLSRAYDNAVDRAETHYVVGEFSGTVDFDPGPEVKELSTPTSASYLAAYSENGALYWVHAFNARLTTIESAIDANNAISIYVAGSFSEDVDFDPSEEIHLLSPAGINDAFIGKFTRWGELLWVRNFGSASESGQEEGTSIGFDSDGRVLLVGNFRETMQLETDALPLSVTSAGEQDGFLVRLATTGNVLGLQSFGGPENDACTAVAGGELGTAIIGGEFSGTADFQQGSGVTSLTASGSADGFLLRLNGNGDVVWSKPYGSGRWTTISSVGIDVAGDIFVSGHGEVPMTADATLSQSDSFLHKLDSAGNIRWERTFDDPTGNEWSGGLSLDKHGNVFGYGSFGSTLSLGSGSNDTVLIAEGIADSYVLKLDTDGNFQWATQMGGSGQSLLNGLAVGSTGVLYHVGSLQGEGAFDLGMAVLTATAPTLTENTYLANLIIPPTVTSLTLLDRNPTNSNVLRFGLTFSEPVVSVDTASNFGISIISDEEDVALALAVSGSGAEYVVSVTADVNEGQVGLQFIDRDIVRNLDGLAVGGPGEFNGDLLNEDYYRVDRIMPVASAVSVEPNKASSGETVRIEFEVSEPLTDAPVVAVNGNEATRVSSDAFVYAYTVGDADANGPAMLHVSMADDAGNIGEFLDSSLLLIESPTVEGEGAEEGEFPLEGEIAPEGSTEGESEGSIEGGSDTIHSADLDGDGLLSLSELLRLVQLHHAGGLHCVEPDGTSDDGYLPGPGSNQTCRPHASDYSPQDWEISLSELLRAIQFYNAGGYVYCPERDSDDGYCLG